MTKKLMVAAVLLLAVLLVFVGCGEKQKEKFDSDSDSNVTGLNGTFVGTSPTLTDMSRLEDGAIIQEVRSYSFDGKGNFSLYRTYIKLKKNGSYSMSTESKSESTYGTYTVNGSNVKLEFSNGETDYSGRWHVSVFEVRIMLGYPYTDFFNEEHSTELTCLKQ